MQCGFLLRNFSLTFCRNALYNAISKGGENAMVEKTITVRVTEELHKDIKIRIANEGISLKDYVLGLIQKDLAKKEK